ncbi:MAG TPA: hypothetical protein VNJ54_03730 [Plantibacter sp.]|uniref:hypothetical protein n=1 Tax=Plantibacter sp. TaxID=1871045 RepID=UPI002BF9424A|nr:hypothetical protein [Plantibacter sp.]
MKTLIASGSGRYADPWHPYDRTSPLIAEVLSTAGFETTIDDDVDQAMTRLDGVDLLIVNAGDPWRSDQPGDAPCAAIDGLAAALERGVGVIAFHAALAADMSVSAASGGMGNCCVRDIHCSILAPSE